MDWFRISFYRWGSEINLSANAELLETSKEELIVDYDKHKIKVKIAKIHPISYKNSPDGSRYGFVH